MIIGIDEVGRGCWAGPLVAAAVEFDATTSIVGLRDSKKLTAAAREGLVRDIELSAAAFGVGWVWPVEINKLGLTKSVQLAMQRAVNEITLDPQQIIIDGNYNYLAHIDRTEVLVKADDSVQAVAAASVLAKVARDTYMKTVAAQHPEYGFEYHVGYGTSKHIAALKQHGVLLDIHRLAYKPIKELLTP